MNVVALRGRLSRPAEERILPSGDRLVSLELSVEGPRARRESVPVVWFSTSEDVAAYGAEVAVVVVGRVRRRFFKAGGRTASRTEVVADLVLLEGDSRRVGAALRAASEKLVSRPGRKGAKALVAQG